MPDMSRPQPPVLEGHYNGRWWTTRWVGPDRDAKGRLKRHKKRFGPQGRYTRQQVMAQYEDYMQREWLPQQPTVDQRTGLPAYTVKQLADEYEAIMKAEYNQGGRSKGHLSNVKTAMAALREHAGSVPARAMRAADLSNVRTGMINAGLSQKSINTRLGVIRQCFKWAIKRSLVPDTVSIILSVVGGVRYNEAKNPVEVRPVSRELVTMAQKHMSPGLADMVELGWLTGMRPGELFRMRTVDIERDGPIWEYAPREHKSRHKGKARRIFFGPKAQKILSRHLKTDVQAAVFVPREVVPDAKPNKRRAAAKQFNDKMYRDWIRRACEAAGIRPHWFPYMLRHSWATQVRKAFGSEAAQVGLGHANLNTTEIYAERDWDLARKVAKRVG
jgi:integrase